MHGGPTFYSNNYTLSANRLLLLVKIQNHLSELVIAHLPIPVFVNHTDKLVDLSSSTYMKASNFIVGQALAHRPVCVVNVRCTNKAISISVEGLKSFANVAFAESCHPKT